MPRFTDWSKLLEWLSNDEHRFLPSETALNLAAIQSLSSVKGVLDYLKELNDPCNPEVKVLSTYQYAEILDGRGDSLLVFDPTIGKVRYLVRECLDSTGQGSVSVAQDILRANRPLVALKRMTRNTSGLQPARFEREIEAYRGIGKHRNIAHFIHSFSGPHPDYYIITEYVEGKTLEQAVYQQMGRGGVSVSHALGWLRHVANGLAVVHTARFIHRDLKPKNILLEWRSDELKLVDFGLAKRVRLPGETDDLVRTAFGTRMGTGPWMPPEQFINADCADERSDVFAFGCVAFFVLFGVPPCYPVLGLHMTDCEIAQQNLPSKLDLCFELRDDVPYEMIELIRDCVKPNPNNRPKDGREINSRLEVLSTLSSQRRPNECVPNIVNFRRTLEDELIELEKDLRVKDVVYITGLLAGMVEKIQGRRKSITGLLTAEGERALNLALDELLRRSNLWQTGLREKSQTSRVVVQQFVEFYPYIRNNILEPLFKCQFVPRLRR